MLLRSNVLYDGHHVVNAKEQQQQQHSNNNVVGDEKRKKIQAAKSFNCLCLDRDHLYCGCGNGMIVSFDRKNNGRIKQIFNGRFLILSIRQAI